MSNQTIPYFDEVESNGNMILEIFNERKYTFPQSLLAINCNYALKIHESYDIVPFQQKQIAASLRPQSKKEEILRKRTYNEMN